MMAEEGKEKKEAEKPPIKAVIFDLDGLLIDSEPLWNRAYSRFLKRRDITDKPEISSNFRGMGMRELIGLMKTHFGLEGDTDELAQEYRSTVYEILFEPGNLVLMEGAEDLLKKLHGKYHLAIATSGHRQEMARKILDSLRIGQYFDSVVSGDEVLQGKPAPDVYLHSAEKLSVSPKGCLALEDAPNGVMAAKSAGMRVYGVNADDKLRAELKKSGADEVYSSLKQLSSEFSTSLEQY